MGKRRNTRLKLVLPVRVVGAEPNNRSIRQMACTLDVCARGARLTGLHQLFEPGSVVAVERGKCRFLFRVMWMGSQKDGRLGQAGIQALDPDTNPWEGVQFAEEPDEQYIPISTFCGSVISAQETTCFYACSGDAIVSPLASGRRIDGKLRDLSAGGCYVQTNSPLKLNTSVAAQLFLKEGTVAARGTINRCDDYQGMWVGFSDVRADDVRILSEALDALRAAV